MDLFQQYLSDFDAQHTITLVGPLLASKQDFPNPVVFVDGGCNFRRGLKGVSVGDGDSCSVGMDVQLERNKDSSDLGYVLQNIPCRFSKIQLFGFLGGVRDHELCNFGEVHAFLQTTSSTNPRQANFEQQILAFSSGCWHFSRIGRFSLLAFEKTTVKMSGDCHFPLSQATQISPLSSHGLSNIGHGEIHIECDQPIFIFFSDI